jgi:aldehyde oxidoreductase
MTGNAIRIACENLLDQMRKADGSYRTYDEMKADGKETKVTGKFVMSEATSCDENGQGRPFMVYQYGLFMAEVTVEIATGKNQSR